MLLLLAYLFFLKVVSNDTFKIALNTHNTPFVLVLFDKKVYIIFDYVYGGMYTRVQCS